MADVVVKVTPKEADTRKLNPKLNIDLTTVTSVVDQIKKLNIDPAAVEAIVEKLHLDPAHIAETLNLDPTLVNSVIDKVKTVDPATVAAIIDEMKNGKLPKLDVGTVTTVIGILSKIPWNDTVKGLAIKLAVFAFGIFCGIGIVYKSGLPLPSDGPVVNPPANVSVYQKRIDELQKINTDLQQENAELRKQPAPVNPPVNPPVDPPLNPPAVVPPANPPVRPGFIIPNK